MMTGIVTMDSSKWLLILACNTLLFRPRRKLTLLTFHAFSYLDGKIMLSIFSNLHHLSSCILCDSFCRRLAQFPFQKMPTTPCLFSMFPICSNFSLTTTAQFSDLKIQCHIFQVIIISVSVSFANCCIADCLKTQLCLKTIILFIPGLMSQLFRPIHVKCICFVPM